MTLIDVTLTMDDGLITFPGDPPFQKKPLLSLAGGDPFNLTSISMCSHSGTHLDAPSHYLEGGFSVDQAPLDSLIGQGIILDMRGKECISADDIRDSDLADHIRVFFRTDNSASLRNMAFNQHYCYLTPDGAEFLVEKGIRLVGIDYLSIENYSSSDAAVHRILLSAGVLIVESLDLQNAPAGPCKIYCLPMKIKGADGSPARVLVEV